MSDFRSGAIAPKPGNTAAQYFITLLTQGIVQGFTFIFFQYHHILLLSTGLPPIWMPMLGKFAKPQRAFREKRFDKKTY